MNPNPEDEQDELENDFCPLCGGGGLVENPAYVEAVEAGLEPEDKRMYIPCWECDAYHRVYLGLED